MGNLVALKAFGKLDVAPGAPPMPVNAIFDLASLSKVTGTTTAAEILVDRNCSISMRRFKSTARVFRYARPRQDPDPKSADAQFGLAAPAILEAGCRSCRHHETLLHNAGGMGAWLTLPIQRLQYDPAGRNRLSDFGPTARPVPREERLQPLGTNDHVLQSTERTP